MTKGEVLFALLKQLRRQLQSKFQPFTSTAAFAGPHHASIADSGDHHGEHRDQNDRGEVSVREFLRDAEQGHRSDGLNQNDAVENQVPEGQDAF